MLAELILFKLVLAIFVVVGVSVIAEKVSPKAAGILAGLPTGTAITLFFVGLEVGTQFASETAVFNMMGLVAMQAFLYFYYRGTIYFKQHSIPLSFVLALAGYLAVAGILSFLPSDRLLAVILPAASIFLFSWLYAGIKDERIEKQVKLSPGVLLLRAAAAAAIIIGVTEAATAVGSAWTGLLSAFPTTTAPLLLIIHATYGAKPVQSIIKHFPLGLGTIIIYSLVVSFAYPALGVYWGTLAAFGTVGGAALLYFAVKKKQ